MTGPRVTIVIPVRDEAERLPACLEAVAAQDIPPALMEVLVVDGGSSDDTVAVARQLLEGRGWATAAVLHSAEGDRSSNLNCGLAEAAAPILVRVDARSRIPTHYVRRCLETLDGRPEIAVVGGRQRAVAAGNRPVDAGVARALNNRWGMGLARYRRGAPSGEAETVYLGAYRTAQVRSTGGWRTDLAVNEDFDLNRRLGCLGLVWFDADLVVDYVPRSSFVRLARQYWAFGTGKARYWRLSGDRPRPRQLVLLAAPLAAAGVFAAVLGALGAAPAGVFVLGALAAGVAIEVVGADGPPAVVPAHAVALMALICVAGAWLTGVAAGMLGRAPRVSSGPARHSVERVG